MARKLGVMSSAVCLVSTGVMTQAWCCLAVVAVAMLLHLRYKPYAHWLVDCLETASLTTCFATLYLGIMLELHKGTSVAMLCSFVILGLQIGFFVFFMYTLKVSLVDWATRKQTEANAQRVERAREAHQVEIDDLTRRLAFLAAKEVNRLIDKSCMNGLPQQGDGQEADKPAEHQGKMIAELQVTYVGSFVANLWLCARR